MQPDEPNDEERLEELPEDNQTPFQPADPPRDDTIPVDDVAQASNILDTTHPATDSGIDPQELYDEGVSGAAEASEPNSGNTVTGYEPHEDED
jgi:hypothetical protein